nr:4-(cytidine 5'-diphospho)-2-C-methyl-D-erythritol kinase [Psychrobacter sp. PraFG1]UNK05168.1 4-(cytidine 5'-diphospho)-2-C-methyl-D-erythritol kinase [Psychrobacter sp. PraFG1]
MTSYAKLSLFSPAKINLFLHITGKRADGYHNLQTVFRLLDWGDTLEFLVTQDSFDPTAPINEQHLPVRLSSTVAITAQVMDNLVIKAAVALLQAWQNSAPARSSDPAVTPHLPVIEVTLNKVLPTGAGLGGGSSNAATTLIALNKLWGFHYDIEALIKIGATVGADVPIFVLGQDAIAEGIGERLTPSSCHSINICY